MVPNVFQYRGNLDISHGSTQKDTDRIWPAGRGLDNIFYEKICSPEDLLTKTNCELKYWS